MAETYVSFSVCVSIIDLQATAIEGCLIDFPQMYIYRLDTFHATFIHVWCCQISK